jgi:hypothetical protein
MPNNNNNEVVGAVTSKVIDTFGLNLSIGQPILCGETNRAHMKKDHPEDFEIYGDKIEEIIRDADFIAKHPQKDSIEYIKIYKDHNDDHVLVAVRASGSGTLFARTVFIMDDEKVDRYTLCGALKPYK